VLIPIGVKGSEKGVKGSERVDSVDLQTGEIYNVRITEAEDFDLYGEIEKQPTNELSL
jgi:hypothetical protein